MKRQQRHENPIRQCEIWNFILNKTNIVLVTAKHPKGKEASQEILLPDKPNPIQSIKFEGTDVGKIQNAAIKT